MAQVIKFDSQFRGSGFKLSGVNDQVQVFLEKALQTVFAKKNVLMTLLNSDVNSWKI